MKVKLREIVMGLPSFNELMVCDLPMSGAFKIASIAGEYTKHVNAFNKAKTSLFDRYGVDSPDGKFIRPDHKDVANTEMEATLDIEVEMPIEKITRADLAGTKIKPQTVINLRWLLEFSS